MNRIKIFSISIAICMVFVSFLTIPSHGQPLDNFKTYTNNDMNFTIQYPSNWEAEIQDYELEREFDSSVKNIIFEVDFLLNEKDRRSLPTDDIPFTGFFTVRVEKIESYLDTDTMTLQNKSIQQHAQEFISTYLEPADIIRQGKVTVGENDGLKLEYYQIGYNFDIYTIANGKLYTLAYSEVPLKVPETLPLVNKMVESFQIGGK